MPNNVPKQCRKFRNVSNVDVETFLSQHLGAWRGRVLSLRLALASKNKTTEASSGRCGDSAVVKPCIACMRPGFTLQVQNKCRKKSENSPVWWLTPLTPHSRGRGSLRIWGQSELHQKTLSQTTRLQTRESISCFQHWYIPHLNYSNQRQMLKKTKHLTCRGNNKNLMSFLFRNHSRTEQKYLRY